MTSERDEPNTISLRSGTEVNMQGPFVPSTAEELVCAKGNHSNFRKWEGMYVYLQKMRAVLI